MERLAEWLGSRLAAQLDLDEERREVVTFGALALLHNGSSLLLTLLLGAATGLLPETAVALLSAAVLRHATGGAHLSSSFRCAAATSLAFLAAGLLGRLAVAQMALWPLWPRLGLATAVLAYGLIVIVRRAPVEAETRPLSPRHREHLRRLSLLFGALFAAGVALGARAASWWVGPGLAGFVVQVFTLTPGGLAAVHQLDRWLSRAERG